MILNTNSVEEMNNLRNEKKKGLVLILFYATWCGHCSAMEPEWHKLEENHQEEINLAKVESEDYDNYEMSANEDRVQGYPTVRLYHKDKMVKEFDGERNFDSMYQFLQDYLDDHPDAKMNNMLLLRGKKTNKHNAKLLETLRTNKKIAKAQVPKRKATKKRKRKPSVDEDGKKKGNLKKKGSKAKKPKKGKKPASKKRGRPKGSKNKQKK